MKKYEIFDLSKYDEAFEFVSENEGTTIEDLGNGQYKIVELLPISIQEKNEYISFKRESLYRQISDKLKLDYDEAVARNADNIEELKQKWLESKDKIRNENPYIKEINE